MTANQLIIEAVLLDNVIYPGQTISPEAQATSELGFNLMLDEWNAQGLAVYAVIKETYALSATKGDYTIGPAGDLVGARPEKIDAWAVHSIGGSDGGKPVDPVTFASARSRMDDEAWSLGLLPGTALTGLRVKLLNYDAAYPVGTIHVYPIPSAALDLDLWIWQQFVQITDFTVAVDFPPGYRKAVLYNLAKDLAPKFGRPLDPTVEKIANECKANLASTNMDVHSIASPPPQK